MQFWGVSRAASTAIKQAVAAFFLIVVAAGPSAARESVSFSDRDLDAANTAMDAFEEGDYRAGASARSKIGDPLIRDLVTWFGATQKENVLPFKEMAAFGMSHADWPLRGRLLRNVDESITRDADPKTLIDWFTLNPPVTAEGRVAVIERLKQAGMDKEAAALVRHFWRRSRIGRSEQAAFLQRYGGLLHHDDHVARINHLLLFNHTRDAQALLRSIKLKPPHSIAVEARFLMRSRRTRNEIGRISALLAKVPEYAKREQGMQYDMMRWHRRTGRPGRAIALLDSAPHQSARPDRWFKERNLHVRQAIKMRNYPLAYRLAKEHRQRSTNDYDEAEWLAGFVALEFLKRPDLATGHFQAALDRAVYAREIARLTFWLGRAAAARRDFEGAERYYRLAARFPTAYYGQHALAEIKSDKFELIPVAGEAKDREAFWSHPFVRGFHLMTQTRRAVHSRVMGFYALRDAAKSSEHAQYLTERTVRWYPRSRQRQMEVRLVRYAHYRGYPVGDLGFPTLELPEKARVEPALVYALIRQESEFLPTARSWVGARGLMQLMPFTARKEARDMGLRYSLGRLTADPAYNVRLGTNHMERLLGLFDGSYPLVLSAYNAGAHRTRRWLADYGDPRAENAKVDWITWIEMIPFDETRNYVKRVLEGYAIYRQRAGSEVRPVELVNYWSVDWAKINEDCDRALRMATTESVPGTGSATETAKATAGAKSESQTADSGTAAAAITGCTLPWEQKDSDEDRPDTDSATED